jgi:hypothetical protein
MVSPGFKGEIAVKVRAREWRGREAGPSLNRDPHHSGFPPPATRLTVNWHEAAVFGPFRVRHYPITPVIVLYIGIIRPILAIFVVQYLP